MVGRFFGGAQATQFGSQDTRCKAGIDIHGRPFGMMITNGVRGAVHVSVLRSRHAEGRRKPANLGQNQAINDGQPHDPRLWIVIRGSTTSCSATMARRRKAPCSAEYGASSRPPDRWPPSSWKLQRMPCEMFNGASKGWGRESTLLATVPEIVGVPSLPVTLSAVGQSTGSCIVTKLLHLLLLSLV